MRVSIPSAVVFFIVPITFAALTSLGAVLAEPLAPGPGPSLTWQQLVEKTRQGNEDIQASERRMISSAHKISAAYSNYYPQIFATASRTQTGSRSSPSEEDYGLALNISENLFAGFQNQAGVKISKTNLEIAETNLQSTKAQVSFDLKSAVAALLYSQSYIKLSQNIIERRELNLRLVQLRFDGGRENKGSLLLSRAYLEEARLDHIEAEQNLIVALGQVAKVLGDSETYLQSFSESVPVLEAPPEPTEEQFHSLVMETPNYKLAVSNEVVSQTTLTQTKSGFYPSLDLTAVAGQGGPTWYPQQDRWSLGVNLTLPLFNGGRDYYSTQSAVETLKSITLNRGTILKEQLVQLKTAYGNYIKVIQRLKVDQAHVIAAETREKISKQKYNNGLSTFEDWDGIETELIKRQKNFIVSQRDRIVSEAAWEQAQGKGVFQ